MLSASLNKTFPSFLPSKLKCLGRIRVRFKIVVKLRVRIDDSVRLGMAFRVTMEGCGQKSLYK